MAEPTRSLASLSDRAFNNYLSILKGSSKLAPALQLSILHSMKSALDPQTFNELRTQLTTQQRERVAARIAARSKRDPLMAPTQGVGRGRVVRSRGTAPTTSSAQDAISVQLGRGSRQLSPTILPSNAAAINPLADFPLTTNAPLIYTPSFFP